jgi:hypothetical protein
MGGCGGKPSPVANVAVGEVESVEALIEGQLGGGAGFGPFFVPVEEFDRVTELLREPSIQHWPLKWQVLGWLKLRKKTGEQVRIDLFSTGREVGAYRINDTYYRGRSDAEFVGELAKCAAKAKLRGGE